MRFKVGIQMKGSIVFLVLCLMLLSSCSVYTNLYGVPVQNQSAVYVPESAIVIEKIPPEIPEGELSEEQKKLAEDLLKRINEKAAESKPTAAEAIKEEPAAQESPELAQVPADVPNEQPLAIIVLETEKVSLQPKATDPDGDALVFAFTSPLNEQGEWQTAYGDAGDYTITVTASDGELTTTKEILIIVNKKEEKPVISSASPVEGTVQTQEEKSVVFEVSATDLNKDTLSYDWKLDGKSVSQSATFEYAVSYDDAGTHNLSIEVGDGTTSVGKKWTVEVSNINRKPSLSPIAEITAKESEIITIAASAKDADGDALTYSISDPRFTQDGSGFTWKTGYESAGSYTVKVSVSDGEDSSSQEVQITVSNANRKPIIQGIVQKK